jgi:hypothetical protein
VFAFGVAVVAVVLVGLELIVLTGIKVLEAVAVQGLV